MPRAARSNTPAGAEAFVRFYLGLVNEAWTTPKAGLLTPLSDRRCQFCKKTEADARHFVSSNTKYSSDPIRLGTADPVLSPPDQVIFEILIVQNATAIIDEEGQVVERIKEVRERVRVAAVWTAGGWRFLDLESLT